MTHANHHPLNKKPLQCVRLFYAFTVGLAFFFNMGKLQGLAKRVLTEAKRKGRRLPINKSAIRLQAESDGTKSSRFTLLQKCPMLDSRPKSNVHFMFFPYWHGDSASVLAANENCAPIFRQKCSLNKLDLFCDTHNTRQST